METHHPLPHQHQHRHRHQHQDIKDLDPDLGSDEPDLAPLPLTRVLHMLGDIAAAPAYTFSQWLELLRKRTGKPRPQPPFDNMPFGAQQLVNESLSLPPPEQSTETNLWDRLAKASMLDIDSTSFSWDSLLSLHRTEHSSSTEHSEDEMNKALEVTVNSGGVVFFALFNQPGYEDNLPKEAAAVIKISSSRMATQSERLGYEFAKWLGVQTPQARVIHNSSMEWLQIKEAAEKARDVACLEGDELWSIVQQNGNKGKRYCLSLISLGPGLLGQRQYDT